MRKSKNGVPDTDVFQGAIVNLERSPVAVVDQDELQLMDECDEEWVRAWRRELSKKTEDK